MSEQFTKIDNGLLVRAPGKVNLSLLIAGIRADGYHEIESIMAKINWYDEIFIEKSEIRNSKYETNSKPEISNPKSACGGQVPNKLQIANNQSSNEEQNIQFPISNIECPTKNGPEIELICKGPYPVPEGKDNLVYKAARLILETARDEGRGTKDDKSGSPAASQESRLSGISATLRGIRIALTKNMPAGSGLGSGSSDAAAILMGINKFLKLGIGKKELAEMAARLGSDVVFFLGGPMAMCTGRGEKVKKLEECEFRVLLVVPDVSVSTKRVYENYKHDVAKFGRLREEINVYIEKKRIDLICSIGANMLQESCFELHPGLAELKKRIESLGIRPVALSGSGSAMFCVINERNEEVVMANREKLEHDSGYKIIIVNNNSW